MAQLAYRDQPVFLARLVPLALPVTWALLASVRQALLALLALRVK